MEFVLHKHSFENTKKFIRAAKDVLCAFLPIGHAEEAIATVFVDGINCSYEHPDADFELCLQKDQLKISIYAEPAIGCVKLAAALLPHHRTIGWQLVVDGLNNRLTY